MLKDSVLHVSTQRDTLNSQEQNQKVSQFKLNRQQARETHNESQTDAVLKLSAYNYKVEAYVGLTASQLKPVLSVLDTGCGPNLIAKAALSDETLKKLNTERQNAKLVDANGRPLNLLGTIRLSIQIGTYRTSISFTVVRKLSADVILGCDFLDQHTQSIGTVSKTLILKDDSRVVIHRRPAGSIEIDDQPNQPSKAKRRRISVRKVRVARGITLPPQSETIILARCDDAGSFYLQPDNTLFEKYRALLSNGFAVLQTNVSFKAVVANFSDKPVRLHKNQILGYAIPQHGSEVYTIEANKLITVADPKPIGTTEHTEDSQEGSMKDDTSATAPQSIEDLDLSHLDEDVRDRIREMLRKHQAMWDGTLGEIKAPPIRISVQEGARPVNTHPYRAGPQARLLEDKEVNRMLEAEVIEPAQSEWASPVVLVDKKDGTTRFCVDYRKLNSVTVKDTYPLPRMDECLDSLGDATIFSALDCNSGYWQLPIAHEDRDKTTFTCHAGTYRFTRMPFGLCNAPAAFQRTVDILLMRYKWKTCLVYLDDIIIFSKSVDEHIDHVDEVLQTLREAGLTLKLKKCNFFVSSVNYLGHTIKPGRLEVANRNQEAIQQAKPPETKTQVRSFVGMCNVYRRFVPNFATVAAPLVELTKKEYPDKLPKLNEEQLRSFEKLKQMLLQPPVLRLPKEGLPYSVDTDASNSQIGCALFQTHDDKKRYPIGYWSRTLSNAERNYSVSEKECLAVVWALTILRPYLERTRFEVHTDHQPLVWLLSLPDNITNARLMRWRLRLSEFDFKPVYKKGTSNNIADALSRLQTPGETPFYESEDIPCFLVQEEASPYIEDDTWDHPCYHALAIETDEPIYESITIDELVREQSKDEFCLAKREELTANWYSPFKEDDSGLLIRVSNLDGAHQIVIPLTLRNRLLHLAHYPKQAGHPGGRKMFYTLRKYYYWPSMSIDVYNTVKQCEACAKESIRLRKIAAKLKLFPATFPLESVALDYVGPLPRTYRGHTHLLVITDRYTKLTRTVPLKNPSAKETARAFCTHWAFVYGPPVTLLSDNGGHFVAKFFQDVCLTMGVKNLYTTAYHPRTNGQTERFNRTIVSALRHYVNEDNRDWDDYTDILCYSYNTQAHRATGHTPFELVLSRPPKPLIMSSLPTLQGQSARDLKSRFIAVLRNLFQGADATLQQHQQSYKEHFDASVRQRKLPPIGSYVYVRLHVVDKRSQETSTQVKSNKLKYRVHGPYEVINTSAETHTVTILKDGLEDTVSLDHVVPSPRISAIRHATDEQTPQPEGTNHNLTRYVFDKIVNHGLDPDNENIMMYKVRWHGYSAQHDTWQYATDLPYNTVVRYCKRWSLPIPEPPRQPLLRIQRTPPST